MVFLPSQRCPAHLSPQGSLGSGCVQDHWYQSLGARGDSLAGLFLQLVLLPTVGSKFFSPQKCNSHFGSQFSAKVRTEESRRFCCILYSNRKEKNRRSYLKYRDCFETLELKGFFLAR